MSMSTSFTADSTFTSTYYPSDSTNSFMEVVGTTMRITDQRTPSSSTDTGIAGEICIDSNYIYYCISADTWKRSALSTW
jgi:hypothetical protein